MLQGDKTLDRRDLLPTSWPLLITTMRRGVARWLVACMGLGFSFAGVVLRITTQRLPVLACFMAVPVRVLANKRLPTSVRIVMLSGKAALARR
jgi:hypothetical protein